MKLNFEWIYEKNEEPYLYKKIFGKEAEFSYFENIFINIFSAILTAIVGIYFTYWYINLFLIPSIEYNDPNNSFYILLKKLIYPFNYICESIFYIIDPIFVPIFQILGSFIDIVVDFILYILNMNYFEEGIC